METCVKQQAMRTAGLILLALSGGLSVSRAAVIQSTVELPPAAGAYVLGSFCEAMLGRCTQNAMVSGFQVISRTIENGDELVSVMAEYTAGIYTNNGGVPGLFLGQLTLPGTALLTYVGRDPQVNPLGTFTTILSDFGFQGMLNGNTFEIKQDPGRASIGSTTILQASVVHPVLYAVSGSMNVAALYSFNGGPFVAAPLRPAELTGIPEPQTSALVGSMLLGVFGILSLRGARKHR